MMARTHGKRSTYNWGCHCDACTAANTTKAYRRREIRHAKAKSGQVPAGVKHGAGAYTNWGCPCSTCLEDHNAKWLEQHNRRRGLA